MIYNSVKNTQYVKEYTILYDQLNTHHTQYYLEIYNTVQQVKSNTQNTQYIIEYTILIDQ